MSELVTALDRARAVARAYRAELEKAAPQRARILDEHARRVGEGWVCGVTTGTEACTVGEAAVMLGVSPGRVRQLVTEGAIPSSGKGTRGHVLLVTDVQAYGRVARARRTSGLSSAAGG